MILQWPYKIKYFRRYTREKVRKRISIPTVGMLKPEHLPLMLAYNDRKENKTRLSQFSKKLGVIIVLPNEISHKQHANSFNFLNDQFITPPFC